MAALQHGVDPVGQQQFLVYPAMGGVPVIISTDPSQKVSNTITRLNLKFNLSVGIPNKRNARSQGTITCRRTQFLPRVLGRKSYLRTIFYKKYTSKLNQLFNYNIRLIKWNNTIFKENDQKSESSIGGLNPIETLDG